MQRFLANASAISHLSQALTDECAPAKQLFDKASDILGFDLLQLCAEGTYPAALTVELSCCTKSAV
jgi:hypothetical protein